MSITSDTIKNIKVQYKFLGNAPGLDIAIARALQVAPYDISVLITGESGTGKETLPRIIHNNGSRKYRKFIAINCGAIPESTIDSELFGHVKGAFTDAFTDHKGYFEEADGGTIFLDEVADMPLTTQVKLLRLIENHEFIKVGSTEVQKADVRIVAATNKNLPQAIKEGKFREDLYYRLSSIEITLPALRERGETDIIMLTRHFAQRFAEDNSCPIVKFTADALQAIAANPWPGNVRQLKNVVEKIALFYAGTTVNADIIKQNLPRTHGQYLPDVTDTTKSEWHLERPVIIKLISTLHDEVQRLAAMLDERGTTPAFVPTVTHIQRDTVSSFSPAQTDKETVIEPLPSYDNAPAQPSYHQYSSGEHIVDVATVKTLDETKRETIKEALLRNHGKRKRTAEELNISERTLYRKIKQYNLTGYGEE